MSGREAHLTEEPELLLIYSVVPQASFDSKILRQLKSRTLCAAPAACALVDGEEGADLTLSQPQGHWTASITARDTSVPALSTS